MSNCKPVSISLPANLIDRFEQAVIKRSVAHGRCVRRSSVYVEALQRGLDAMEHDSEEKVA